MISSETHRKQGKRGPNGLQDEINLRIRREISEGRCKPGSRLPFRAELEKTYRTTPVTIQKAFDKLAEEGFIRSEGKRGTFVTSHPPCLSNYAIAYPFHLDGRTPDISFFSVLANLAKSGRYAPDRKFTLYFGLNGHVDEPDYKRLQEDVQDMRLAGIIFASAPFQIAQTPLFKEIMGRKDLSKIAFMSAHAYPKIPAVTNDYDDSMRKSLDYLKKQRCRRLAILHNAHGKGSDVIHRSKQEMIDEAAKCGMTVKPWWIQGIHPDVAHCARGLVQLLFQGPKTERPDALMIMDDSLVESATNGIADAGLASPRDIHVVGFCNFPEPPPAAVPVKFIGMNVLTFLDTCLESLDRQRDGKKVRPLTVISSDEGEIQDKNI